jgi:hypothetical protein
MAHRSTSLGPLRCSEKHRVGDTEASPHSTVWRILPGEPEGRSRFSGSSEEDSPRDSRSELRDAVESLFRLVMLRSAEADPHVTHTPRPKPLRWYLLRDTVDPKPNRSRVLCSAPPRPRPGYWAEARIPFTEVKAFRTVVVEKCPIGPWLAEARRRLLGTGACRVRGGCLLPGPASGVR